VGRQLGTLPLKGLAFVRRRWHGANDSAGGKGCVARGRAALEPRGRVHAAGTTSLAAGQPGTSRCPGLAPGVGSPDASTILSSSHPFLFCSRIMTPASGVWLRRLARDRSRPDGTPDLHLNRGVRRADDHVTYHRGWPNPTVGPGGTAARSLSWWGQRLQLLAQVLFNHSSRHRAWWPTSGGRSANRRAR
jgi:hypothetical protein